MDHHSSPRDPRAAVLDPRDPDPVRRARLAAWLRLLHRFGPGPSGPLEAWRRHGTPECALAREGGARRSVDRELDALARAGARVVPIDAPDYPRRLVPLSDAPPLLFVRGRVEALSAVGAAVVGARTASAYGLGVARRLARALAERGASVVSGLARGIDAAAHDGALDAEGVTVAVQACGPDFVYPPEHDDLVDAIEERGAVLTEFPVGVPPLPYHFPLRNRLISALSRVVVVVEAREQSGSLHTARHALDQGVEVMAVPGPVDRAGHRGSNRLLRDGAAPVLELADVLDRLGDGLAPPRPAGTPSPPTPLSAAARRLLEALEAAPAPRDELAEAAGCSAAELAEGLLELELLGRVQRERDGCWRRVDPDPPPGPPPPLA